MADELVEKIARAMFDADYPDLHWEHVPGVHGRYYRQARACLALIETEGMAIVPMEPTEEMLEAGNHAFMHRNLHDPESDPIRDFFRAMLAAASKQG